MRHGHAAILAAALACCCLSAQEIGKDDKPTAEELRKILFNGSIAGREEAAKRLASERTPQAMECLLDGMADKHAAYIAADAVEGAIEENAEGMGALLMPGLKHKHWRTRMLTCFMLYLVKDKAAAGELAAALADKNVNVRIYAAQALRTCGDRTAPEALITALADECGLVKLHAAAALGETGDPAAVPALIAALDDADAAINAARSLGATGAADAEAPLLAHASDVRARVAWACIEALGRLGKSKQTAQKLASMAEETADPRTAKLAGEASKAIQERIEE
ncbi:MAG: HEAT repeat domain-containing protein [Planctomycetes bacterium]|nr:HEAT repeat domain-containing protein [Planctomycetota bacterium]